jgi:hypothetical protein
MMTKTLTAVMLNGQTWSPQKSRRIATESYVDVEGQDRIAKEFKTKRKCTVIIWTRGDNAVGFISSH